MTDLSTKLFKTVKGEIVLAFNFITNDNMSGLLLYHFQKVLKPGTWKRAGSCNKSAQSTQRIGYKIMTNTDKQTTEKV